MLDFGRSLEGKIRPIATVTTPLSIVYEGSDDFADSLKELDKHFSIQYHGHFGHYIDSSFQREYDLLCKVGFKPSVYAGGWWIMNETIAGLLDRNNFTFDTTINNKNLDSFGNSQRLPDSHNFIEIPTWRHYRVPSMPQLPFCLSFHDYDLIDSSPKSRIWIHRMKSLAIKSQSKSMEDFR